MSGVSENLFRRAYAVSGGDCDPGAVQCVVCHLAAPVCETADRAAGQSADPAGIPPADAADAETGSVTPGAAAVPP